MHSQFDEEKTILDYFSGIKNGHLLDIGAFDGVELSNSRALIELGWSGVLVEPCSRNIDALLGNNQNYASRVKVVQAAISGSRRLSRLFMDETPTRKWATTINPELLAVGHVEQGQPIEVYVPTIPIDDLIQFGPYDFISIDAEWEDYSIMANFPKRLLEGLKLICVETRDSSERKKTQQLLADLGFKVIHETLPNVIAARQ